jgi:hypothetical protein
MVRSFVRLCLDYGRGGRVVKTTGDDGSHPPGSEPEQLRESCLTVHTPHRTLRVQSGLHLRLVVDPRAVQQRMPDGDPLIEREPRGSSGVIAAA